MRAITPGEMVSHPDRLARLAARLLAAPCAVVTTPRGALAAGVGIDAPPSLCGDVRGPLLVTGAPSLAAVPLPGGGALCVLDRYERYWDAQDLGALQDLVRGRA